MDPNKGLILVNTGNGKGKTTAALGLLVRATGHNKKCAVVQFIKSVNYTYGEKFTLEKMGVELYTLGAGCTWEASEPDIATSIISTWEFTKSLVFSDKYDIIVLDEVNIALWFADKNLFPFDFKNELIDLLKSKPENLHLVLTGRYAPPEIIELADMVTEMNMVKHHYNSGVKATQGIEF